MDRLLLIIILVISNLSLGNSQIEHSTTSNGKFKIEFPCEPNVEIDTAFIVKQFIYRCNKDETYYTVIQTKYTNNMYHSDSANIESDLYYTQRKLLGTKQVHPIGAVPKSTKGYPGQEFRYEYFLYDKFTFRQIYIVKNTVFELRYTAPMVKKFHDEIDEFFNSFELVNTLENENPYLNLPSQEELDNRPFKANFFGQSEQVVQVLESEVGKVPAIMEANQIKNTDGSGVLALMVMYVILPKETDEEIIRKLSNEQLELISMTYPDAQIIENKELGKRKDVIFEYRMGGEKVVDKRIITWTKDKLFTTSAIFFKDVEQDKRVNTFLESFEIKK